MSTKQIVIFTFMILFLAVMLFSLGAWFHLSTDLEVKKKTMQVLQLKEKQLEGVLNGDAASDGLKKTITNPDTGLAKRFAEEQSRAEGMQNMAVDGTDSRKVLYEDMQKQLDDKWPVAESTWKKLYADWELQNKNIAAADERLASQVKEKNSKVVESQEALTKALSDEDLKRHEATKTYKEHSDDLINVRNEEEEVLNKVTSVTREIRSPKKVVKQGKVIQAADALKTVTIDLGSNQGVRRGMHFDVYSGVHQNLVKKGMIEITQVQASSSYAVVLPPPMEQKVDPQTGWVAPDPNMRYSVFSASGADETQAQELIKPKTKAERLEAIRIEKIEKEEGLEAANKARQEGLAPSAPVLDLGKGFVPIAAGDWVNNTDFVPIISQQAYGKKTVEELLGMADVNTSTLTFFFTDSVPPYRKEFLKRLCERNHCRTTDIMSADVNYVVTTAPTMRADLLEEELNRKDNKDKDTIIVRQQRKTLEAMKDGDKYGAGRVAEDELEAFFTKRERKQELLRGKTTQPGQSTFFIAGETRDRSVPQLQHYIESNGGVISTEMTEKVDYVVAGAGLDKAFYDKIKKLGLKIVREDELPKFFGRE
jgi:NAD-dependent DNA ligase